MLNGLEEFVIEFELNRIQVGQDYTLMTNSNDVDDNNDDDKCESRF